MPAIIPLVPDPKFTLPVTQPVLELPAHSPSVSTVFSPVGSVGPTGPAVWEPGELDRLPKPVFQPRPIYPEMMRQEGVGGQTIVDFVVDRTGNVRDAYEVSATERDFGAAAVRAVSKWRFKPGLKAGHAVAVHMRLPVNFSVDGR